MQKLPHSILGFTPFSANLPQMRYRGTVQKKKPWREHAVLRDFPGEIFLMADREKRAQLPALFSLVIFAVLSFVGQNATPQALGSPDPCAQAFQLDNLAVIYKHIDFRAIILDIPGKHLRVSSLKHHFLQP